MSVEFSLSFFCWPVGDPLGKRCLCFLDPTIERCDGIRTLPGAPCEGES